jgi:hypothetical protein
LFIAKSTLSSYFLKIGFPTLVAENGGRACVYLYWKEFCGGHGEGSSETSILQQKMATR